MKSTMGAPLSQDEEIHILTQWERLYDLCVTIEPDPDPLDMLNYMTDLIGKIWECRRAIDDGWHSANRRAFPDPPKIKRRVNPVERSISDLEKLGFTNEQIIETLKDTDEQLVEAVQETSKQIVEAVKQIEDTND